MTWYIINHLAYMDMVYNNPGEAPTKSKISTNYVFYRKPV